MVKYGHQVKELQGKKKMLLALKLFKNAKMSIRTFVNSLRNVVTGDSCYKPINMTKRQGG